MEENDRKFADRVSYRVNIFGFPAAAGAIGNPGLTDIRLVVEWLRDNIEGFGYAWYNFKESGKH